ALSTPNWRDWFRTRTSLLALPQAVQAVGNVATTVRKFPNKGHPKNCHRSSGAPHLPANDSALFSFRLCVVHQKRCPRLPATAIFRGPHKFTYMFGKMKSDACANQ